MTRQTKRPRARESFRGAKPIVYHTDGRLYYVKNENVDKLSAIPSQQRSKLVPAVPKLNVKKLIREGTRAVKAARSVA